MANFILTYDLNGPQPSHAQMDAHLGLLGTGFVRARVLETVWYVAGPTTATLLRNYVERILSPNDQILVVEASRAAWRNLKVADSPFKTAFESQPPAIAA